MKCGFVAIIGRPSVGKSTLLNAICGEKVAITSSVPQTTRNAIRGIVNRSSGQIVFLDTPGYHESDKKLNIYLKDVVHRSLNDADVVLYVMDASRAPGKEEGAVMNLLSRSGKPIVAAVNKIDLNTPLMTEIRGLIRVNLNPAEILEVSAVEGRNLEGLVQAVMEQCPEGELHYPTDFYTDQDPEFRIAEIIREQAIIRSEQEVPHSLYVELADMEFKKTPTSAEKAENIPAGAPEGFFKTEEPDTENPAADKPPAKPKLWVRAFLVVERSSQVGILVGHKGEKIKAIRIGALREMKKVFPWKISLDLRVKVNPKWRKKDPLLKRMMGSGEL